MHGGADDPDPRGQGSGNGGGDGGGDGREAQGREEPPPPGTPPPPWPSGPAGIPWEQRDRIGFGPALVESIKLSLIQPTAFFSRLHPRGPEPPPPLGPIGSPLLYAILLGVPAVVIGIFWQMVAGSLGILFGGDAEEALFNVGTSILFAALSPLWIPIGLVVLTAVIHVFLMLFGASSAGFLASFRVFCYASAAELFQLIPMCGGLVGAIWGLVITVIGLRIVHQTTLLRTVAAVLLPVLVCCGIAFYVILAAGLAGLATFYQMAH